MKDVVVFIGDGSEYERRLTFAVELANRWQAHLIAIYIANRIDSNSHASFAIGDAIKSALDVQRSQASIAEGLAKRFFERLVRNQPFTHEWHIAENEGQEALLQWARHSDLAVIGTPAKVSHSALMREIFDGVIFASGRPSLLVPPQWSSSELPKRVVIGWNESREAARAVADSLPFLMTADSVHLVIVHDGKIDRLLGSDPGDSISRHLGRHDVHLIVEQHVAQDAGEVLLARTRSLQADLLVLGAYGHSRISEFVFGGVTRTMLSGVEFPLLLSH